MHVTFDRTHMTVGNGQENCCCQQDSLQAYIEEAIHTCTCTPQKQFRQCLTPPHFELGTCNSEGTLHLALYTVFSGRALKAP